MGENSHRPCATRTPNVEPCLSLTGAVSRDSFAHNSSVGRHPKLPNFPRCVRPAYVQCIPCLCTVFVRTLFASERARVCFLLSMLSRSILLFVRESCACKRQTHAHRPGHTVSIVVRSFVYTHAQRISLATSNHIESSSIGSIPCELASRIQWTEIRKHLIQK